VREIAIEEKEVDIDTLRSHLGKPQHLGLYNFSGIVFRRAALGAFVSSQNNLLVYKSVEAGGLEAIKANLAATGGLTFSVAESFFSDHLFLGTTGKYMRRGQAKAELSILDADKVNDMQSSDFYGYGTGTGIDLGMMVRDDKAKMPWSFGLHIENVGDTSIASNSSTAPVDDLKQQVNLGVAIEPGTKFSRLKLLFDLRDVTNHDEGDNAMKTHFGAELSFGNIFGVMAGLNQGYPTGGIYADIRVLRFDMGAYTEEVGEYAGNRPDTRYFARLMMGF